MTTAMTEDDNDGDGATGEGPTGYDDDVTTDDEDDDNGDGVTDVGATGYDDDNDGNG
jgi:hypothetical protein